MVPHIYKFRSRTIQLPFVAPTSEVSFSWTQMSLSNEGTFMGISTGLILYAFVEAAISHCSICFEKSSESLRLYHATQNILGINENADSRSSRVLKINR